MDNPEVSRAEASNSGMSEDVIFQPLAFRRLTVKNRIFRSSISGRWDNYNGSGSQTRLNWEEKFARGGCGAIITSFVPVHVSGRILPNYAMIDDDDKIPFWREVGKRVNGYGCKLIMQLSHGGRQRDIPGIENFRTRGLSSTNQDDSFHGLLSHEMNHSEINRMVQWFADGARRAREAGLDGIELHASHGYLFTQFLSSAINDRKDDYGGSLENRARFLREVMAAIRKEVGNDFHLQVKMNAIDLNNALYPWEKKATPSRITFASASGVRSGGQTGCTSRPEAFFPIRWFRLVAFHPTASIGGMAL